MNDFKHQMKLNEMLNVKLSYFDSAIPQMQRMLNSDKKKKIEILRKISSYPVNNNFCKAISLR